MDRTDYLLQGLDRENSYGIEIGPFFAPIAPKSKGWHTTVVDFTDQEALLKTARNHTAAAIRAMADNVEPVDIVWRDVQLDEACLQIRPDGFDYLIASHVIEHFPDIIDFFKRASALARPDFIMSLAVPDLRLTFDFFRPLSSTADALLAHREKRRLHTTETLFSAHSFMAALDGAGAWMPGTYGPLTLPASLDHAHQVYLDHMQRRQAGDDSYTDAHAWIFTPSSFELMILELNHLGYIDFSIMHREAGLGSEFLTRLRKQPHGLNLEQLHERRLALMIEIRHEMADAVRYLPAV